jgi:hypothetical protein
MFVWVGVQELERQEAGRVSRMVGLRAAAVAQLWNITVRFNLLHPTNWSHAVLPIIQATTKTVSRDFCPPLLRLFHQSYWLVLLRGIQLSRLFNSFTNCCF